MKSHQFSTDLQIFDWWGRGNNPPPENLKTKKQLSEIGLSPLNPVGVIYWKKQSVYLYDPEKPESVKPKRKLSPKQLETLAKAREKREFEDAYKEWYYYDGQHLRRKSDSIVECQKILSEPDNWIILDTETTGLYFANAEIVQIGIINLSGDILFDSLVKPTIPIPQDATAIHGITDKMVEKSPTFDLIYPQIKLILEGKRVCIYNAYFDTNILERCCHRYKLIPLLNSNGCTCIMEAFARFFGEYSTKYNNYKYQPLEGDHTAIGDCKATLELIKLMAGHETIDTSKEAFRKKYYEDNQDANG